MEFPDDGSGLNQFVGSRITYSPNGDTAYIMTSMATTNRTYLNAVDTNPSIPSASTILRSTDIAMGARSRKGKVNFTTAWVFGTADRDKQRRRSGQLQRIQPGGTRPDRRHEHQQR